MEEQRRLEELLIEYPPEDVEMRRWTKIANALGILLRISFLLCLYVTIYSF